jgi:selenium-binding protein 1
VQFGGRCRAQGFNPAEVPSAYGDTLTFWDWKERKVVQTIKLGPEGLIPLETRFLHDPAQAHGYVGAALSSNVIHFTKVRRPWSFNPKFQS